MRGDTDEFFNDFVSSIYDDYIPKEVANEMGVYGFLYSETELKWLITLYSDYHDECSASKVIVKAFNIYKNRFGKVK